PAKCAKPCSPRSPRVPRNRRRSRWSRCGPLCLGIRCHRGASRLDHLGLGVVRPLFHGPDRLCADPHMLGIVEEVQARTKHRAVLLLSLLEARFFHRSRPTVFHPSAGGTSTLLTITLPSAHYGNSAVEGAFPHELGWPSPPTSPVAVCAFVRWT